MPRTAAVTIKFGPYASCGLVGLRDPRLDGLKTLLECNGHSVEFTPNKDREAVQLVVNGEDVYQCNITELEYGGDGELDPICSMALESVEKAY